MKTFKTICTVIVLTVTGLGLLGFGGIKLILALEESGRHERLEKKRIEDERSQALNKLLEDIQTSSDNERQ